MYSLYYGFKNSLYGFSQDLTFVAWVVKRGIMLYGGGKMWVKYVLQLIPSLKIIFFMKFQYHQVNLWVVP